MKYFNDLTPEEEAQLVPLRPVLIVTRGSQAHGTYVSPEENNGFDDLDVFEIYVGDLDHYFGMERRDSGRDIKIRQYDMAAYEIIHFCRLAANANPAVLATLWTDPKYWIMSDWEGRELVAHRRLFASKIAAKSFIGYAQSQLERMTAYDRKKDSECCPGEKYHSQECPTNLALGRGRTKKFATGFMGEKRKGLVEKYGYDCKNASHLIRLLAMGAEFLETGDLRVDRTSIDADTLIAIKTGKWALNDVLSLAGDMRAKLRNVEQRSPLPDKPDLFRLQRLIREILSVAKTAEITLTAHHVKTGRAFTYEGASMAYDPSTAGWK